MRKIQRTALMLAVALALTGFRPAAASEAAQQPVILELPGTTSMERTFDPSFLSVTGFAKGYVNDRTDAIGTDRYRVVTNAEEFLQALEDAKRDRVDVIEIAADLDLGWNALSEKAQSYSNINAYGWEIHANGINNPYIEESGVSQLSISNTRGLTIFSRAGNTVEHAEWKIQGTCSDIVIRNLKFDEMWRWSEAASSWDAGWTLMKFNGVKGIWVDHCTFTLGADGNVDSENGASHMTMSWCEQSLPTTQTPGTDSMLYRVITYMEYQYEQGKLPEDSRYRLLRENGATKEQILAYSAYHQGLNMNGSGEKDFKDSVGMEDGNFRIHITYAYDKINNIGARFPMIRQGTAHLVNCFVDNRGHMALHNDTQLPFYKYGKYSLNRSADARDGACIGIDTSVFLETNALIGIEKQPEDYSNMAEGFNVSFSNVYNHSLAVNSKVSKNGVEYIGSSWDNNGENLFFENPDAYWIDKSTIGHWKWFSSIDNIDQYTKGVPPKDENGNYIPFSFSYSDGPLPYSYQKLPLSEVEQTIDTHAGAYTYQQGPEFWLRTEYKADDAFAPADKSKLVPATGVNIRQEELRVGIGDTVQLVAKVAPSHASQTEVTWNSSNPECAKVLDSGLVVIQGEGDAVITATTKDGTKFSDSCRIKGYTPVTSLTLSSPVKSLYLGDETTGPETIKLVPVILPENATYQKVLWTSSNPEVLAVDEEGVVTPKKKGSGVKIICTLADDMSISASVRFSVKEGVNPSPLPSDTPEPTAQPQPTNTPEPTVAPIRYGDVNADGEVGADDALEVLKNVVKLRSFNEHEALAADVDGNHIVEAKDALEILKHVVRLLERFEVETN